MIGDGLTLCSIFGMCWISKGWICTEMICKFSPIISCFAGLSFYKSSYQMVLTRHFLMLINKTTTFVLSMYFITNEWKMSSFRRVLEFFWRRRYEVKKEKRRLDRKIFEGVEVIVSLDARIQFVYLLVLFTRLGVEDVDSSCFKK